MSGMLSERDFVILWLFNLLAAVIYLIVGARGDGYGQTGKGTGRAFD